MRQTIPVLALALLAGCVPARQNAPAVGDTLTVLTLNIWHDQQEWPRRLELMTRELRRLDPDVIVLQEVLQDAELPNQAETLGRMLGYEFHFTSVDPEEQPRRYGNAILTRHPVLVRGWTALEPLDDYRNAAHVRIAFGGREIDLYNTHLHHTGGGGEIRRAQLVDLLDFIDRTRGRGPVILAGDFNTPVESAEMRLLDERFLDAYGALHAEPEARARTTLNPHLGHTPRRIDHVFLQRGAFEPLHATIVLDEPDAAGVWTSDHFGVLARFRILGAR